MKWKDRFNHKYLQISLYVIFTAVIVYCLKLVADHALEILSWLYQGVIWITKVLKPILIGFVFAYLLDPINNFFENKYIKHYNKRKWKRKRVKGQRSKAVFTTVVIVFLAFAGIVSLLVYSITDQIRLANFDDLIEIGNYYLNNISNFFQSITDFLGRLDIKSDEINTYVKQISSYLVEAAKNFATGTVLGISSISGSITTLFFSIIIGVYFMIDGRMLLGYLNKVAKALFSSKFNVKVKKLFEDMDVVFSGYIRGQLTDALVMMVLISLVLSITGVKFAIVIGIFAGVGNLIPYCGPIVAYITTTLVCLVNGQYKTLFIAIIALIIIQAVDGNFIGPKLLSKSIQVHPLLVIISLIFGSAVGGFFGMLVAVPVGAFIKVLFVRFIDQRISKKETDRLKT